jgi:amino acid transporter
MLPFKSLAFPWNAYFGLTANIFLALVQGWTTLSPFDAGTFIDAYILLPIFGIMFLGYKFWFKTRFWTSLEVDLDSGMRKDMDAKDEYMQEPHAESHGTQSFLKNVWRKC